MHAQARATELLTRHRDRVLALWRERSGGLTAEPLLQHVERTLEGAPLDGRPTPFPGGDAFESLRAAGLIEDILFEVLEQEQPLTLDERARLRGACRTLRDAALELVQSREEQLRGAALQSEERYLTVARTAGFAIWDWDLTDHEIHWSYSVESLLGHPIDSLSKIAAWLEFVHPQDRDRVESGLRHAVETGRTRWSEAFRFLRREGTYASVIARGWILHDTAGTARRIVGGLTDVTEQRRLEQELEKQILLTQAVADNAASCLFVVDPNGVPTYMNPAAVAVTGYRLDELSGRALHDVLHPLYPDGSRFPVHACEVHRPRASVREHECVFTRSDGTEFPASCSVMPLPTGAVLEFRDITRQKQQHQQLVDAVTARDEFLAVASHELRTPLTALQLQLQTVTRGPLAATLDDRVKARLGKAEVSLSRMVELVTELLDVAKMKSGRIELKRERIDVVVIVREVAQRLLPSLREAGSELTLELPEQLDGQWDRSRLDQVLTNLLSNAIKYGDGKPIEIRVAEDDGWMIVSVRDRGIGIAPEDHSRVFDRFERAVSERHYGGFGLGLWIVRRIINAMGGTIRVESALGQGSRFEVRLPRGDGRAR